MLYRIGLENGMEGRSMAWALDHPGCYAYGADDLAALAALPGAIRAYADWIAARGGERLPSEEPEIRLEETWQCYNIDQEFEIAEQGYEVDAWFRHDWKPLAGDEVARALKLLAWSRADLLAAVEGLDASALDVKQPGERWSIRGILRHVGGAEWWYLDRLGLAFRADKPPDDVFVWLDLVRARLVEVLPTLAGSRQVVGVDGEFWSPRKLLRRASWHERDHVEHIRKLRASL